MGTKRNAAKPADEIRVASRGRRDRYSATRWGGRLTNPDPNLAKYSRDGVGLVTRILYQFADVAGYCAMWGQSVLVTDRALKAAQGETPEEQAIADRALARTAAAWARVPDQLVVLLKILMGRYYGFSRAEMVLQFDEVVGEWVPHLYDVPAECWFFTADGREFLVTSDHPMGIEVDPSRFLHFQWGSLDTKWGEGDLPKAYLPLWKIQKLEGWLLQRIEDNESLVVVHIPRWIIGDPRKAIEDAYAGEFQRVLAVPSEEQQVRTELPTLGITTAGAAGRQEMDAMRLYERQLQIALLGAPMTGDKTLGTGKLEETRKKVWDDKTPLGSAMLDEALTRHWVRRYSETNLTDVPPRLWPRFASDAREQSIDAGAAGTVIDLGERLAAGTITPAYAEDVLVALGMPRNRAKVMIAAQVGARGRVELE
ncbi:MAG: hypothetical protein WA208_00760, partial [Thermoanaerobaculia bacterium]